MVKQLAKHLAKIAGIGRKIIKFKKKDADQCTWAKAKKYFRDAIEDLDDKNKVYGMEPGLQANAAVVAS